MREVNEPQRARLDWAGNAAFLAGLGPLLIGITSGVQPYRSSATGWGNPVTLAVISAGLAALVAFVLIERRVVAPMLEPGIIRVRAFAAGALATLRVSISRGGLQFVLIIWLQGVWLLLHGYLFWETPCRRCHHGIGAGIDAVGDDTPHLPVIEEQLLNAGAENHVDPALTPGPVEYLGQAVPLAHWDVPSADVVLADSPQPGIACGTR